MEIRRIETPLVEEEIVRLRSGDKVLLSGYVYTARDAAHKRFATALAAGEALPLDVSGQIIYYCGPSPSRPGRIIGAAGPTTRLADGCLRAHSPVHWPQGHDRERQEIRSREGGNRPSQGRILRGHRRRGALLSCNVLSYEIVAYADLGPEAVARLYVRDFPLFVINDSLGNDLYEIGRNKYRTA